MIFDSETKHWQKEYAEGNVDTEGLPGEIIAVLDGTAEESFWWALKFVIVFVCSMFILLRYCV